MSPPPPSSLKNVIKALPFKYPNLKKKSDEISQKLKKKMSAVEREKLKKQLARVESQLQPYLEYEEKLFNGDKINSAFYQEIMTPLEKCVMQWAKVLKKTPFDEGAFQQLKEMYDEALPILNSPRYHFLEKKWVVDELTSRPLTPSGVLMPVNDEYSHIREREKFSNAQARNLQDFFKDGFRLWGDDIEMVCMYLTDGIDHYSLGVEFRQGNPKKISEASSMDTASREAIDDKAWEFINTDLFDGSYHQEKALIQARKEKKMLEALPEAKKTKPVFRI